MNRLLLAIVICSFILSSIAGNNETRAERREREIILDSLKYNTAQNAMEQMQFVIKVDKVTLPSGKTIFIQLAKMNFITVDDDYTIIQVAVPNIDTKFNEFGGITVDGLVTYQKLAETKKGDFILKYSVLGNYISAQVHITLLNNSNRTIVRVIPNYKGGDVTLYGELLPAYDTTELSITPDLRNMKFRPGI
ncbi:MAG: DUF4251 domain-containing protein [Bacteroidales bacterium]